MTSGKLVKPTDVVCPSQENSSSTYLSRSGKRICTKVIRRWKTMEYRARMIFDKIRLLFPRVYMARMRNVVLTICCEWGPPRCSSAAHSPALCPDTLIRWTSGGFWPPVFLQFNSANIYQDTYTCLYRPWTGCWWHVNEEDIICTLGSLQSQGGVGTIISTNK